MSVASGEPAERAAQDGLRGRDVALVLGAGVPAGLVLVFAVGVVLAALDVRVGDAAIALTSLAYVPVGALAWYVCGVRRGGGLRALGIGKTGFGAVALMLPVALGLTWIEGMITAPFAQLIGENRNPQIDDFLGPADTLSPERLAWLMFAAVLVAPIVEEVVFRGLVYRYLRQRTNVAAAAIVSGALFAAVHVYLVVLPALFVFGVALALVTERFGSIVPAIALHATKNALALVALYVALNAGV